MRRLALTALCVVSLCMSLSGYDLNTKALTPIKHGTAPKHDILKMVVAGKPKFAIVFDSKGEEHLKGSGAKNKSIARAVGMIGDAFEKCTGTRPDIVDCLKNEAKLDKYPLWLVVGDCAIARKNGLDWKTIPEQGFTIRTFQRGIMIVGHDSTLDPARKPNSRGTMYGVLDFTERFLGVRYFYPGDIGTYWPKITDLTVTPANYTDSPRFMNRTGGWHLWRGVSKDEDLKKYGTLAGNVKKDDRSFGDYLRFGSKYQDSNHSPRPEHMAQAFPDKLKTIFYTTSAGKFMYNDKGHIGNLYNVLDLRFADILMDVWKAAINGEENIGAIPRKKFIGLYASREAIAFGNCDTYQVEADIIGDPTVRELGLITEADRKRHRNALMANVYGRFYHYLAGRMEKELPGTQLIILAYYNAEYAPIDPRYKKLPSNILVNLCNVNSLKYINVPKKRAEFQAQVKEWVAATGKPIHRLWLYDEYRNPYARAVMGEFVGDVPKALGKDLGDGCLFLDSSFNFPYYTSFYAAYRSMWNPDWDVDAGIEEHFPLFYGKEAGKYLLDFHRILKKDFMAEYYKQNVAVPLYPAALVDSLEELLKKAEAAIAPDSIEMRRFKIFAMPWAENFKTQRTRIAFQRPVHVASRILPGDKVQADGVASEEIWKTASPVKFINQLGTGEEPKFAPVAKVAWDEKGVYLSLESQGPPLTGKGLWNNCSYELFLMPGKAEQYYQFAFDAEGNTYFGKKRVLPVPGPVDSNYKVPGWVQKNIITDKGWSCEIFVPFTTFEEGAPKVYDSWRFNLVRTKFTKPKEVCGNSMTVGNHHYHEVYGCLIFGGKGD